MRKLFFVLICLGSLTLSHIASGQTINPSLQKKSASFEYFIYLSGADKREDVIALEELIGKKEGITYFMAERFPVKYFILRSARPVTAVQFSNWIDNKKYKLEVFGNDLYAKEKACLLYNKKIHSNR